MPGISGAGYWQRTWHISSIWSDVGEEGNSSSSVCLLIFLPSISPIRMDADVWSHMMSIIQMWLQHRLYSVISQYSQRCTRTGADGGSTKSHSQTQPGGLGWSWSRMGMIWVFVTASDSEEKRLQAALVTQPLGHPQAELGLWMASFSGLPLECSPHLVDLLKPPAQCLTHGGHPNFLEPLLTSTPH